MTGLKNSFNLSILTQRLRNWLWPRRKSASRSTALREEIQFWKDWFLTGGLRWPEDFQNRFNPNQPIQNEIATCIDRMEENPVRILDVGSGPLTILGKKHPSKELEIIATDLLANEYDQLLLELQIEPLVRTVFGDVENLVEQFGKDSFYIVHGQNCIDHTAYPMRAIDQMLAVCKPNGYVILRHAENEGQTNLYQQLHQWNFTCENNDCIISNQQGKKNNITKKFAAFADVVCIRDGREIVNIVHKKV